MWNVFKSGFMIKTTTRQGIILYWAVIILNSTVIYAFAKSQWVQTGNRNVDLHSHLKAW